MKSSTNSTTKPQNVSAKTKFSTLNLNQTYKPPSKPSASGGRGAGGGLGAGAVKGARNPLKPYGKVTAPPPVNLPSRKSEKQLDGRPLGATSDASPLSADGSTLGAVSPAGSAVAAAPATPTKESTTSSTSTTASPQGAATPWKSIVAGSSTTSPSSAESASGGGSSNQISGRVGRDREPPGPLLSDKEFPSLGEEPPTKPAGSHDDASARRPRAASMSGDERTSFDDDRGLWRSSRDRASMSRDASDRRYDERDADRVRDMDRMRDIPPARTTDDDRPWRSTGAASRDSLRSVPLSNRESDRNTTQQREMQASATRPVAGASKPTSTTSDSTPARSPPPKPVSGSATSATSSSKGVEWEEIMEDEEEEMDFNKMPSWIQQDEEGAEEVDTQAEIGTEEKEEAKAMPASRPKAVAPAQAPAPRTAAVPPVTPAQPQKAKAWTGEHPWAKGTAASRPSQVEPAAAKEPTSTQPAAQRTAWARSTPATPAAAIIPQPRQILARGESLPTPSAPSRAAPDTQGLASAPAPPTQVSAPQVPEAAIKSVPPAIPATQSPLLSPVPAPNIVEAAILTEKHKEQRETSKELALRRLKEREQEMEQAKERAKERLRQLEEKKKKEEEERKRKEEEERKQREEEERRKQEEERKRREEEERKRKEEEEERKRKEEEEKKRLEEESRRKAEEERKKKEEELRRKREREEERKRKEEEIRRKREEEQKRREEERKKKEIEERKLKEEEDRKREEEERKRKEEEEKRAWRRPPPPEAGHEAQGDYMRRLAQERKAQRDNEMLKKEQERRANAKAKLLLLEQKAAAAAVTTPPSTEGTHAPAVATAVATTSPRPAVTAPAPAEAPIAKDETEEKPGDQAEKPATPVVVESWRRAPGEAPAVFGRGRRGRGGFAAKGEREMTSAGRGSAKIRGTAAKTEGEKPTDGDSSLPKQHKAYRAKSPAPTAATEEASTKDSSTEVTTSSVEEVPSAVDAKTASSTPESHLEPRGRGSGSEHRGGRGGRDRRSVNQEQRFTGETSSINRDDGGDKGARGRGGARGAGRGRGARSGPTWSRKEHATAGDVEAEAGKQQDEKGRWREQKSPRQQKGENEDRTSPTDQPSESVTETGSTEPIAGASKPETVESGQPKGEEITEPGSLHRKDKFSKRADKGKLRDDRRRTVSSDIVSEDKTSTRLYGKERQSIEGKRQQHLGRDKTERREDGQEKGRKPKQARPVESIAPSTPKTESADIEKIKAPPAVPVWSTTTKPVVSFAQIQAEEQEKHTQHTQEPVPAEPSAVDSRKEEMKHKEQKKQASGAGTEPATPTKTYRPVAAQPPATSHSAASTPTAAAPTPAPSASSSISTVSAPEKSVQSLPLEQSGLPQRTGGATHRRREKSSQPHYQRKVSAGSTASQLSPQAPVAPEKDAEREKPERSTTPVATADGIEQTKRLDQVSTTEAKANQESDVKPTPAAAVTPSAQQSDSHARPTQAFYRPPGGRGHQSGVMRGPFQSPMTNNRRLPVSHAPASSGAPQPVMLSFGSFPATPALPTSGYPIATAALTIDYPQSIPSAKPTLEPTQAPAEQAAKLSQGPSAESKASDSTVSATAISTNGTPEGETESPSKPQHSPASQRGRAHHKHYGGGGQSTHFARGSSPRPVIPHAGHTTGASSRHQPAQTSSNLGNESEQGSHREGEHRPYNRRGRGAYSSGPQNGHTAQHHPYNASPTATGGRGRGRGSNFRDASSSPSPSPSSTATTPSTPSPVPVSPVTASSQPQRKQQIWRKTKKDDSTEATIPSKPAAVTEKSASSNAQ